MIIGRMKRRFNLVNTSSKSNKKEKSYSRGFKNSWPSPFHSKSYVDKLLYDSKSYSNRRAYSFTT